MRVGSSSKLVLVLVFYILSYNSLNLSSNIIVRVLCNAGHAHFLLAEERKNREMQMYEKKLAEKERKDGEYIQQQQELKERRAASDLQKQKKEEAEQEALAEAAITKIRKNQGSFLYSRAKCII